MHLAVSTRRARYYVSPDESWGNKTFRNMPLTLVLSDESWGIKRLEICHQPSDNRAVRVWYPCIGYLRRQDFRRVILASLRLASARSYMSIVRVSWYSKTSSSSRRTGHWHQKRPTTLGGVAPSTTPGPGASPSTGRSACAGTSQLCVLSLGQRCYRRTPFGRIHYDLLRLPAGRR